MNSEYECAVVTEFAFSAD